MVDPRICHFPDERADYHLADEAVELAESAGLVLDEWQTFVLRESLVQRSDGKWSAFEVGINVARQNGKGAILEARQLAGLFLIGERLQVHSAHLFDTSLEAWRRLKFLIEDTPDLERQVKRFVASHGEEGIELKNGCRIRFRTRTKGGGRGFSGDTLYMDEAMFIPEVTHGAIMPILSARPNAQMWYTGSAVDQLSHEHGVVFTRVRERAQGGEAPRLFYAEWSVEGDDPDMVPESVAGDPAAWSQGSPALGIRIDPEYVALERAAMSPRNFAVERLGIGDYPRTDHVATNPINLLVWAELADRMSEAGDHVCFAFDVSPERRGSISVAGKRADDLWHVEVVEDRPGTRWMVARIKELVERHRPAAVVCDSRGPGASLVSELEQANVTVEVLDAARHAQACGRLVDELEAGTVRHLGQPELDQAIRAASTRPLGDSWAWSRRLSSGNISPLVSCTLALYAAVTTPVRRFVVV